MPSSTVGQPFWRRWGALQWTVAGVIVAIIGVAVAVIGIVVAHSDSKSSLPTSIPPISCPPADQPGAERATVVHLAHGSPLGIGPVYYTAKLAGKIQFEAGGELRGEIPRGKQLFQLAWADPTTKDSTPDHNPGNGTYYRFDTFSASEAEGCWIRPQKEMAYDGADGLTFRIYFILVDDDHVSEFMSSKYRNGYNDEVLKSLRVTRLAYFLVPTKDLFEG
jgi:hypothetical protein